PRILQRSLRHYRLRIPNDVRGAVPGVRAGLVLGSGIRIADARWSAVVIRFSSLRLRAHQPNSGISQGERKKRPIASKISATRNVSHDIAARTSAGLSGE